MRNAARIRTTIVALALFAAPRGARASDPVEDAQRAAIALEAEGRAAEAVRVLVTLVPDYPQELSLPLQIGWMHHRAGRFEEAAYQFSLAHAMSPMAAEPRYGLAESLARLGRCEEALPHYQWIRGERPDLAEPGIARCTAAPAARFTTSVTLGGAYYPDHPEKRLAGSVMAGFSLLHRSGFYLDAAYRYNRITPPSDAPYGAWDQHEAYASIGYAGERFGFLGHYAFLHDGSGGIGRSHHAGFTARVSPFGDIELRGAASFYDDGYVLRLEPSWRIPIFGGLSLRPGAGIQYAAGEGHATFMAAAAFDHGRLHLSAGGKYGDEVRPVYFNVPVIYDVHEKIAFGAFGAAGVNVSDGVRIHLTYAFDRLKHESGAMTSAHALALGIAASF